MSAWQPGDFRIFCIGVVLPVQLAATGGLGTAGWPALEAITGGTLIAAGLGLPAAAHCENRRTDEKGEGQ